MLAWGLASLVYHATSASVNSSGVLHDAIRVMVRARVTVGVGVGVRGKVM